MNKIDFLTSQQPEEMATEISCLKALLTLILKTMGQADGSKVILNMEKLVTSHDNPAEAAIYQKILNQMRQAYRE